MENISFKNSLVAFFANNNIINYSTDSRVRQTHKRDYRGFLKKTLVYDKMKSGSDLMLQPKLTKVETISPLKLRLFYETGEVKLFDVAPYATGPWYGQLKNESYFNAVQLLPGGVGIEWPEGQDVAPHELYENSIPVKKTA